MVLLPEEAEMTLAELRQMAARQQHQIEAQQQLLVAKEQRLKFLKQQEVRHHSLAEQQVDTSCIQNLRDKVEAQELKLRHLRALRGQVEQQKTNNGNLGAELESIRALFSEKEKELNLAVNKVEELTRQLDEIRNNNNRKRTIVPTITTELENFRRELMYRTKLTEQQNNHVSQQRELITQKQQDISHLDNKIGELTQRLHRKRLLNQQLASQIHNASLARHSAASVTNASIYSMSNIAAVEPIQREIQEPEHTQDDLSAKLHRSIRGDLSEFSLKKNDPKYQTLPYNTKFTLKGRQNLDDQLQADDEVFSNSSDNSSSSQRTSSISPPKPNHNMVNFAPRPFGSAYNANTHLPGARIFKQQHSQFSKYSENVQSKPTAPVQAVSALSETYSNGNLELEKSPSDDQVDHCSSAIPNNNDKIEKSKPTQSATFHSNQSITDSKKLKEKYSVDNGAIVKPVVPPKPAFPVKPIPPPRQTTTTPTKERNSSEKNDIISMALSVLQSKSSEKDKSALRYSLQPTARNKTPQDDGSVSENRISTYFPKPVSNDPKLIENGNISENVKRKPSSGHLPIKPKPLTIRKTPGLEPPKLKVQPTVNLGMYRKIQEPNILSSHFKPTVGSTITAVLPQKDEIRNSVPSDDQNNADDTSIRTDMSKVYDENEDSLCLSVTVEDSKHSELEALDTWEAVQEVVLKMEEQVENSIKMSEQSEPEENSDSASDSLEGPQNHDSSEVPEIEAANCENELSIYQSAAFRRMRKGNLKTEGSVRSPRRVSFDPLALLLDAALEGELELVKKTASEVPNPSAANDEGITALHNAICAGHFEVVTFLIEFGCDVNAQDSDGWTPLHCAASCNNLPMVKFLVERGACIFATTLSDHETAAEKCEEDEEGFDGCSEYLYGLQENLGVINEGIVYAVYDYEGQNSDELSFKDGDMLNVLRNGDDQENEWWWSRLVDEEGYVPRNLLGLYPRIAFRKE